MKVVKIKQFSNYCQVELESGTFKTTYLFNDLKDIFNKEGYCVLRYKDNTFIKHYVPKISNSVKVSSKSFTTKDFVIIADNKKAFDFLFSAFQALGYDPDLRETENIENCLSCWKGDGVLPDKFCVEINKTHFNW